MEFIDNTGHIFSLSSSDTNSGWEYNESEYVFWMPGDDGRKEISVSSYYIMQIVPYIGEGNTLGKNGEAIPLSDIAAVRTACSSNIFKIFGYEPNNDGKMPVIDMGDASMQAKETYVTYRAAELLKTATEIISPFFVVCRCDEAGAFMTNVLIEVIYYTKDSSGKKTAVSSYAVARVGAVAADESEKLEINAGNFGLSLPRGILSAVYQSDVVSGPEKFDASLYNEKLKEYLMHRMCISGETGNYNSMRNALKWFGWGDKLKISKLLQTDNELLNQYVRDDFDIADDVLNSFKRFRNTSLVSFKLKENDILYKEINGEDDSAAVRAPQTWAESDDFNGEALPETEDLFSKYVLEELEQSEIEYYEPYYLYNVSLVMLKLAFFKYYYKKYFCPVHAGVMTASVERRAFMPDIKITQAHGTSLCERPVLCQGECVVDIFGLSSYDLSGVKKTTLFFESEMHWVDRNFLEFSIYKKENYYTGVTDTAASKNDTNSSSQVYETHEMCVSLPVRFWSNISEKNNWDSAREVNSSYLYKADIIVSKRKSDTYEEIWSASDQFTQSADNRLENIVIIPKLNPRLKSDGVSWWTDGEYRIDICCNGRWFSQVFDVKLPELTVQTGYLQYKYDPMFSNVHYSKNDGRNVITNEKIHDTMWEPSLVGVTNADYVSDVLKWKRAEESNASSDALVYNKNKLVSKYGDKFQIPSCELSPEYYNIVFYVDVNDDVAAGWYSKILDEFHNEDGKAENSCAVNFQVYWMRCLCGETNADDIRDAVMNDIDSLLFDTYLMQDASTGKYHIVYISRFTVSYLIEKIREISGASYTPSSIVQSFRDYLIQNDKDKYGCENQLYGFWTEKHNCKDIRDYAAGTVDTRFLINRMQTVKTSDSNTVPHDKIICLSLYKKNNKEYAGKTEAGARTDTARILKMENSFYEGSYNLPFKLDAVSAKWKFIPYSINIKDEKTVTANANTALMSMQESKTKYMSGYYNVEIDYSLDGVTTQTHKLPYKIRIK